MVDGCDVGKDNSKEDVVNIAEIVGGETHDGGPKVSE